MGRVLHMRSAKCGGMIIGMGGGGGGNIQVYYY